MTAKHYEVILYQDDGWTAQKILKVLNDWPIVETYAFILHDLDMEDDGSYKKPHYHVYIGFGKSSTSIQSVANRFKIPQHLVQKIKSNKYYALRYFLHSGVEGKHQYQVGQMVASFNVQDFFDSQSTKKNLDRVLEECAAGIITRANVTDCVPSGLYAKYRSCIENAIHFADMKYLASQDDVDIPVIWVYGPSGMGKTTVCKLASKQQELAYYVTANGNDPFSGYEDQPSVIMDELRPHVQYTYSDLLQVLAPNTVAPTHARFYDKVLKPKVIWITSIYSPVEYYNDSHLPEKESDIQLYRRLREIWHVEEQSITISRYDMKTGYFVEMGKADNPVPAYLALLAAKKQKTQLDSVSLLNDVNKEYQQATTSTAAPPAPAGGTPADDTEKESLPYPDASEQKSEHENLSMFDEAS